MQLLTFHICFLGVKEIPKEMKGKIFEEILREILNQNAKIIYSIVLTFKTVVFWNRFIVIKHTLHILFCM